MRASCEETYGSTDTTNGLTIHNARTHARGLRDWGKPVTLPVKKLTAQQTPQTDTQHARTHARRSRDLTLNPSGEVTNGSTDTTNGLTTHNARTHAGSGVRVEGALQLQLTAIVTFALLRYLSEFRLRVSSF